jgi:hypothetical protein
MKIYTSMMDKILKKYMTIDGYHFYKELSEKLPYIWDKPTSSTGKYHKKSDGRIPDLSEHVFEMIFVGSQLLRVFGYEPRTTETDLLLLSIVLHDALKYGPDGKRKHTTMEHDQLMGDLIRKNKKLFNELFEDKRKVDILEETVRYHSGRYSTDIRKQKMDFSNFHPHVFFVHMLDILSSRNFLKIWKDK